MRLRRCDVGREAGGAHGGHGFGDARIERVLEQTDGAEALAIEGKRAGERGLVVGLEQAREAAGQGRPDTPRELVGGRRRATESAQRVSDALGDSGLRIGEGTVEIEEDRAAHRIPARMKLCTNWRWNSRNATRSGPDVISVAAVITDQSTP